MTDGSGFQDFFSSHAACYARARPTYPAELFAYLAELSPRRKLAWDVGTGNGQAAVGLAAHFERVIATDASAAQLTHAARHERIEYRAASAEEAVLPAGRVDLATAAVALHWFRLDAFYENVRRAAGPGGVIAAWCYSLPMVGARVDEVLARFYRDVTGPYWAADRKWVEERYETIAFPFEEIRSARSFECRTEWRLVEYLDYVRSWSAVQRYRKERGSDPVELVEAELAGAWGDGAARRAARWPLHMRIGRVHGGGE